MLTVTRFNTTTLAENYEYKRKKKVPCIYGSPSRMPPNIVSNYLFVIEMNNSTNIVEGIGFIQNKIVNNYREVYRIYQNGNYNRFIFKGFFHVSREELLQHSNTSRLVKILDTVLFKGKGHMKRGIGFNSLTNKILARKIKARQIKKKARKSRLLQIVEEFVDREEIVESLLEPVLEPVLEQMLEPVETITSVEMILKELFEKLFGEDFSSFF